MTSKWPIYLVVGCTFVLAVAQILLKKGASAPNYLNLLFVTGLFIYAVVACLLLIALKYGELSVLYPILATTFLWVSILAVVFIKEEIPLLRWMGIMCIIIGVSLIGGKK